MISKKAVIPIVLIFTFFILPAYAQNFHVKPKNITIAAPERELDIGEKLEYSVEWLGIPVGIIMLKTEGVADIKGRQCYHITATVFPNKFFQHLYDIEYTVHSYIDKEFHYTRRFEKIRRMDKNYEHIVIDFDQEGHKAFFYSQGSAGFMKIAPNRPQIESRMPPTTEIPYGTQDLLSSFYYFRFLEITPGKSYPVNIYYNQRNWLVDMQVGEPFLRELRKKGNFPAVQISPDSLLNNYILGKRKLIAYLTTDSRRTPIEFKLETAMGPVYARIQNLSD